MLTGTFFFSFSSVSIFKSFTLFFVSTSLFILLQNCGGHGRSNVCFFSRTPETPKTMNNLIAAARVKQRQVAQAQFQPLSTYYTQGGTPRPSTIQPFLSASSNIDQADWQGVLQHQTLASPSTNGYQSISQNEIDDI
ncbi:hypothetical protein VIGAN_07231000, partial [Vigna angularis var. angularis]